VFPLEHAAAAYEYGRTGRRRGKVVVQVERS
jgi:NADPH:quinone reductase-like Zn-dependent oxidoreductase